MAETLTTRDLFVPSLTELVPVLENALKRKYKEVKVSVVPCPDLSQPPFNLAGEGLGGSTGIADVGGVMNMEYVANHNKYHWDLKTLSGRIGTPNAFWIGAGACKPDCSRIKDNSEYMPNSNIAKGLCLSKEAYIDRQGNDQLVDYHSDEFSSLANMFVSEGKRDTEVIKIEASIRIEEENPITCMRLALKNHFKDKQIGLGGVLLIKEGKIKSHVMPGFPSCDVYGSNMPWLKYFEVSAPITCLSVMMSNDSHGDDLRLEHTHFISQHHGGHYHYDVTPLTVAYEGYFNVASKLYRVGRAYPPTV